MDVDRDREHHDYDSDDSMPDLQSVSNSSDSDNDSDSDSESDRRQVHQQTVHDDDDDGAWTDVDDDMPPLEPTSGNRRPRVDDDQDQDRDRRHPSMRRRQATPPTAPPPPNPQVHNQTHNRNATANGNPFAFNRHPLGQIAMMLTRGILAPNGADVFFGPGGDLHMPPPPKDSPENAAKIIGGLAIVPVGLIRRLERASPPADDVGAVGGDSGCAICWDRLLDGDGAEFASEASTSDAPTTASETRIIALPCAHVFHAACLIPWFSRPGQTTCPTCRFDVDPAGLIWYDGQKNAPGPGLFDGPGGAFNFELPLFMPHGMDFPEMPHNHGHGGEDAEEGDGDDNIPPLEPIPHTHMPAQPQQPTQPLPPTQPPPTQTPARPNTTVTFDIVFSELGPILPPVELASVSNNMGAPPQQVLAQNHGAPNAGATPPPATTATPNTPPPAANANAPPPTTTAANENTAGAGARGPPFPFGLFRGVPAAAGAGVPDFAQLFRGFGAPPAGDAQGNASTPQGQGNAQSQQGENAPQHAGNGTQQGGNAPQQLGGQRWTQGLGVNEFMFTFPLGGTPGAGTDLGAMFGFGGPMGNVHAGEGGNANVGNVVNTGNAANPRDGANTGNGNADGANRGADALPRMPDNVAAMLHALGADPVTGEVAGPGGAGFFVQMGATPGGAGAGGGQQQGGNGGQAGNAGGAAGLRLPPWWPVGGVNGNAGAAANVNTDPANANTNPNPANAPPPPPRNPGIRLDFPGLPPGMHFHATHTHAHTIPGPHVHFHGVPAPGPTPAREPRTLPEWAPPPAPGPTLRDRLERRERELGLRCADASCGIGPSDEEPFVEVGEDARRVVALRPAGVKDTDAAVCAHAFHPACLVSAQRARGGWREPVAGDVEVPVVCSVCRAEGFVEMDDWVRGRILPLD